MKLSVVIICWNDWKVIENCLRSIFENKPKIEFEVIVPDNGSTDGSVERILEQFPMVRLVENDANLGFARGNNAGIRKASGEYILILNPDTIVNAGSLDRWIEFAARHPEAGAFGCRVLNPDGTYQESARPFPTPLRYWIAALYLRPLGYLSNVFLSDKYVGWKGDSERTVDWQSGCCVMFRGALLNRLGGFDEQFFYHYEEVDLCRRLWTAGYSIAFTPEVTITHLGGQSVGRYPVRFVLERGRNRYRYFYKHFGRRGARQLRCIELVRLRLRYAGFTVQRLFQHSDSLETRMEIFRTCIEWNKRINPTRFVENGEEPEIVATQHA